MKNIYQSALLLLLIPTVASAADYKIDSDHTKVIFKVRHMGISTITGHFGEFKGTFSFDQKDIKASKTSATITAKSVDTDNLKRDTNLRSAEFLDVATYPLITFTSKEIQTVSDKIFQIVGDLTIHGITKSVTLVTAFGGAVTDPWGNERAAFEASTSIKRKDFGLTWNKLLETGGLIVGDDVKIIIEVEGIKKKGGSGQSRENRPKGL